MESKSSSEKQLVPMNPTPFLKQLFGKRVVIKLKWGMEYVGTLSCADAYMNVQLSNVEEFVDNSYTNMMAELIIRCNNILYIREKDTKDNGK